MDLYYGLIPRGTDDQPSILCHRESKKYQGWISDTGIDGPTFVSKTG